MEKKKNKKVTTKKYIKKIPKGKAFTLIELLAVIIILGILMIIAIPAVTYYINSSRKTSYISTAKEIISGARTAVNEGKLEMYSPNTTYYIPASYIKTENGLRSPYGEFTEAYVGVIFNENGYKYYWTGTDSTETGIKDIIKEDLLTEDDIESDVTATMINDVVTTTGIGNRTTIKILNDNGTWSDSVTATNVVSEYKTICKRAKTLHTDECNKTSETQYCSGAGYTLEGSKGTKTVTYGNLGTIGTLATGDAFDCDVNGDKIYDSETERFYYVSEYYDTHSKTFDSSYAVLIFYSNFKDGEISISGVSYDSSNQNCNGPVTAVTHLPSTSKWSNVQLKTDKRRILGEWRGTHNVTSTSCGTLPTDFSYSGKAARLLTAQELMRGCGLTQVGTFTVGELDNCIFLYENSRFVNSNNLGAWLETPRSTNHAFSIHSQYLYVGDPGPSNNDRGVKPVIEIPIEYLAY